MQIAVYDILEYLVESMAKVKILEDFFGLTSEDIKVRLAFAVDREKKFFKEKVF
jgi:uncharacterized protein (DUF433 family)